MHAHICLLICIVVCIVDMQCHVHCYDYVLVSCYVPTLATTGHALQLNTTGAECKHGAQGDPMESETDPQCLKLVSDLYAMLI